MGVTEVISWEKTGDGFNKTNNRNTVEKKRLRYFIGKPPYNDFKEIVNMISQKKAIVTTIPCKEASNGAITAAEVVLPTNCKARS